MADCVLQPPKQRKSGNCQQQRLASLENAAEFPQGQEIIFHMLDYVGREDEIELPIREWQGANITQTYLAKSLICAPADCFGALVDPGHPGKAEIAKQAEIAARAGANIQDLYIP